MNTTFNLGPKLKNARETMRLSIKEASERLRINPKFLTMLEEENLHQALPLTFMKGYLRSYSRLLNFTENEINLAVNQLNSLMPDAQIDRSVISLAMPKIIKKDKWHRMLTYVVILTLILLVTMWWKSHSPNFHVRKSSQQPALSPIVQPTMPQVISNTVEPPATTVLQQKIVPVPQTPLKKAENPNRMKMAVPEEPGLDLSEEE